MAELTELAPAYYGAADLLTDYIEKLKLEIKETKDPMRRGMLKSKLYKLRKIRKEARDTGSLCEHYYERGFYRESSNYGSAPVVIRQHRGPAGVGGRKLAGQWSRAGAAEKKPAKSNRGRPNSDATVLLADILLDRVVDGGGSL